MPVWRTEFAWLLLKTVGKTLFRRDYSNEVLLQEKEMAHLQTQQGQCEIYSLGTKWGSVDGWKITKARGILARLIQQDSCWRQVRERRCGGERERERVCVCVCVCVCGVCGSWSNIKDTRGREDVGVCAWVYVVCVVCVKADLISKIPEEESLNWLSRILIYMYVCMYICMYVCMYAQIS